MQAKNKQQGEESILRGNLKPFLKEGTIIFLGNGY